MKKLLTIISLILISYTGWAQTNTSPYASKNEWGGFGEQIAIALKAASGSFITTVDGTTDIAIDKINDFIESPAGKWTLVFISVKIFLPTILKIACTIILLIIGIKIPKAYLQNIILTTDEEKKTRINEVIAEADQSFGLLIAGMFGGGCIIVAIIILFNAI